MSQAQKRITISFSLHQKLFEYGFKHLKSVSDKTLKAVTKNDVAVQVIELMVQEIEHRELLRDFIIIKEISDRLLPFQGIGMLSKNDDEMMAQIIEFYISSKKEEGAALFKEL